MPVLGSAYWWVMSPDAVESSTRLEIDCLKAIAGALAAVASAVLLSTLGAAGTILGADDKSAVAAMLEAAARLVEDGRTHPGVELLFTPKEEVGLMGADAFDESRLAARLGHLRDTTERTG